MLKVPYFQSREGFFPSTLFICGNCSHLIVILIVSKYWCKCRQHVQLWKKDEEVKRVVVFLHVCRILKSSALQGKKKECQWFHIDMQLLFITYFSVHAWAWDRVAYCLFSQVDRVVSVQTNEVWMNVIKYNWLWMILIKSNYIRFYIWLIMIT